MWSWFASAQQNLSARFRRTSAAHALLMASSGLLLLGCDGSAEGTAPPPEPDAADALHPDAGDSMPDAVEDWGFDSLADTHEAGGADAQDSGVSDGSGDENDVDASDAGGPWMPQLRPITRTQTLELGAHARRLHTESVGVRSPMAWAMVNISCQERALALEFALAATTVPLGESPPDMIDDEISSAYVRELLATPAFDSATINITGPLATEQTLRSPEGSPIPGEPWFHMWPYHHGVVVNVEGSLMVLDLSVGDEPLPVDAWTRSFVDSPEPCVHMAEEEWDQVWSYWLAAFSGWLPETRPERTCGYTFSPMFAFRVDQDPLALLDFLQGTPSSMQVQFEGFRNQLREVYGVTLADEEIPRVTSLYDALTEGELCAREHMPYCDTL